MHQKVTWKKLGGSIWTSRSCECRKRQSAFQRYPPKREWPSNESRCKSHVKKNTNSFPHGLQLRLGQQPTYNLVVYTCLYHSHSILDHLQDFIYIHPKCLAKVLNQQPCVHLSVFHPLTTPKRWAFWPLPTTKGSFKKGKRRFDLSLIRWKSGPTTPGNKEIPNLETIMFRVHVRFRGVYKR